MSNSSVLSFKKNDSNVQWRSAKLSMDDSHGYIYRVFFLMESKVFVNLTYLYISEINRQGLIFSVGLAHLMISNKICEKNITIYIRSA